MAVTLRASEQGLAIVDQERKKNGWTATATAWCDAAQTTPATLKRFRRGLPVQQDAFIGICQAVGIKDWERIVDDSLSEIEHPPDAWFPTPETIQSKRLQLQKHNDNLEHLKAQEAEYVLNSPSEIQEEKEYRVECIKKLNLEIQEELERLSPLPPQRYARFVGRQNYLNSVLTALEDSSSRPILAIDGIGGVGKTALTREIVNRSIDADLFYSLVWESAKPEEFTGESIRQVNTATIDFDSLLTQIASKLGFFEVRSMKTIEQKRRLVQNILSEERYLIVVDNLETFQGYHDLVNNLEGLFTRSKVILTTRRQVAGFRHIQSFSLGGMEPKESFEFLRVYATERPGAAEIICSTDESILEEIHQRTGGLPLSMELIVGQLTRFSLSAVLKKLQAVNYKYIENIESDENVYQQFYRFIYGDSWEQLSKTAKDLLICLGEFDLSEGAKIDDAIEVTEMSAAQLEESAAELIQFSLVYRRGQESQQTFFIHPITHLFVQREVVGN